MREGLDYAIKLLKRGAARHKYYASGDYTRGDTQVKRTHFDQMQACLGAVTLLQRKRSNYIKEQNNEYKLALEELEKLIDLEPKKGSVESDRLELLALLIEEYEKEKIKQELPDPIEAIKFRMEQQNLTQGDLIPFIGSRSKVSEILSKKRPLTLRMIRALHSGLGIPANVLLNAKRNVCPSCNCEGRGSL